MGFYEIGNLKFAVSISPTSLRSRGSNFFHNYEHLQVETGNEI
ncbi:hypothetical protein GXM_05911 [Nostoc sphaeroides CCNUC1]|uniref:Uncharacterized protein n=1 Tax=Nostoc sphaeroides CCNUC1 TaxID=2653204 RepID=A0A5P8W6M7_9NOSO|nr:hypothetical protein GXM_05911 [Nostoc sphaeroides CCNUC1]